MAGCGDKSRPIVNSTERGGSAFLTIGSPDNRGATAPEGHSCRTTRFSDLPQPGDIRTCPTCLASLRSGGNAVGDDTCRVPLQQ